MTIHAHIICWNRADVIHLTIGHYKKFCDKIFIWDNFSDDKTREIAESLGCEVKLFGVVGSLDDGEYKALKNGCWKGSPADWVIIVDDDEILYSEDIKFILRQASTRGETIFKPQGISIHSELMPKEDWLEIRTGRKDNNYSKLCVFNPEAIREIGYEYGCHTHMKDFPKGRLIFSEMPLYLLHYRSVGGVERLIKRHAEYRPRFSPVNKRWNLAIQYMESDDIRRKNWIDGIENSVPLLNLGIM